MKISSFQLKRALRASALLLVFSRGLYAAAPGELVVVLKEPPYAFDPAGDNNKAGLIVALNLYEPLVALKGEPSSQEFAAVLSATVPSAGNGLISGDGRRYVFPVREGVYFHDGTLLTPEDVRYSLLRFMVSVSRYGTGARLLKPVFGVNSPLRPDGTPAFDFKALEKAVRVEGSNVIVTLEKAFPPFLSVIAASSFALPKAWAVKNGEWDGAPETLLEYLKRPQVPSALWRKAVGTGPFRLVSQEEVPGRIVLAANERYWQKPPALSRVHLLVIRSEATRVSMLETGDADYGEFSRTAVPRLAALPGVRVADGLFNYSTGKFISFNFRIKPEANPYIGSGKLDGQGIPPDFFSDPDVRKGMAYAFDYETYFTSVLRSGGVRVTTPLRRPYASADTPYVKNHEKAAGYFKKAWGGALWNKGFYLSVPASWAYDGETGGALRILAGELKKINPGFILDLAGNSGGAAVVSGFQGLPLSITSFEPDYPSFYDYAFNQMHSQGALPRLTGYSNPEADKLCDEVLYLTGEEREKILKKIDGLYEADMPQIMLYAPGAFMVFKDGLKGVTEREGLFALHNIPSFYAISSSGPRE